jgi:very-short-patch-repair endonuclease
VKALLGMSHRRNEIATLLETSGGVIARRQHPELAEAVNWLVRRGELTPVLPGVYAPRGAAERQDVRIRAAMLWDPDAVVTGRSAARLSFWPQLAAPVVGLAVTRHHRVKPRGFELVRRVVPPELISERDELRLSCAALTALDLCESVGGDGIDTALRTRSTTLEGLRTAMALTPGRAGNATRRQLLFDSRDKPWSAAERLGHRVLRDAGITGWKSNLPVLSLGQIYFVDVAWEGQLLALEIDGRLHETDEDLFESDRWRQNHLVLQGWRVLRCTWRMLKEHPEQVVQAVLACLNP